MCFVGVGTSHGICSGIDLSVLLEGLFASTSWDENLRRTLGPMRRIAGLSSCCNQACHLLLCAGNESLHQRTYMQHKPYQILMRKCMQKNVSRYVYFSHRDKRCFIHGLSIKLLTENASAPSNQWQLCLGCCGHISKQALMAAWGISWSRFSHHARWGLWQHCFVSLHA